MYKAREDYTEQEMKALISGKFGVSVVDLVSCNTSGRNVFRAGSDLYVVYSYCTPVKYENV